MHDDLEGKHGVQSLEVGMSLLKAMVAGTLATLTTGAVIGILIRP